LSKLETTASVIVQRMLLKRGPLKGGSAEKFITKIECTVHVMIVGQTLLGDNFFIPRFFELKLT